MKLNKKNVVLIFGIFFSSFVGATKLDESKPQDRLILFVQDNKADEIELMVAESKIDLNAAASNGDFPLESAVANKRNKLVSYLLVKGANPNKELQDGSSLLYRAVRAKNEFAVDELLKYGADVNYQMKETGDTILHFAVRMGDVKLVKKLVGTGAKANLKNMAGKVALELAPKNKAKEIKRILD